MMSNESLFGKCVKLKYEKGDYYTGQGVKGGGYGRSYYKNGYRIAEQGNGWSKCVKPSKLILTVEVNSKYYEVWIDRYFKASVGRLTSNRVHALIKAMPSNILLHKATSGDGNTYYVADEGYLEAWKISACL